jgi:hypothetical protein
VLLPLCRATQREGPDSRSLRSRPSRQSRRAPSRRYVRRRCSRARSRPSRCSRRHRQSCRSG